MHLARIDIAPGRKLPELDLTLATSAGNNLARWLTALPPNTLDARGYRRFLQELARRLKLGFKFYGEADLKRLGAGAFLAVARGNGTRDAGIAHLSYRPRGAASRGSRTGAALSLVGKGVCFDTGGTNLKPHKSMLDMHTDMEGSAVAVGSLYALHALRSPLAVDCWLAITENRIGPLAYKPQDVVRAFNGTTIQVIHTDAEGRMILADALGLAAARKPRAIIDYATLTGACVYALTERYSGAFTNRPEARDLIESAGSSSGERVWCFPMDADFDTDLESGVADIMQCAADGKGDHILAARFLSRFVPKEIAWLHLDLAAGSRHGGLGAHRHRNHGVRGALHARSIAPRLATGPMNTLRLRRPDDWHVHLRDGAALGAIVKFTAERFGRAIVMPNLKPPITTTALARAYRERIIAALPANARFEPLLTLYLTDATPADEIDRAKDAGFIHGVKLYPAGATTHSDAGVTDVAKVYRVLARMEEIGMPLLVHGETPQPDVDVFDRETHFIDSVLRSIVDRFAGLRVVLEHITTARAVEFVTSRKKRRRRNHHASAPAA